MTLSDRLRKDAHAIWEKIIQHPFVLELYKGDLPLEKFKFYILQDYQYLVTAMKNFGVIVSKATSIEAMKDVIDILNLEAKSEFDGYIQFLGRLGYSQQDVSAIEPIPVSISYSSYLLSTSSVKSYAEALSSVLPCFWSYAEIAAQHKERLRTNSNSLYKDWAETYGTDSYLRLVEKMKMLVNRAEGECSYAKLKEVFITSSRYELMFWDAVYNQQEWPV